MTEPSTGAGGTAVDEFIETQRKLAAGEIGAVFPAEWFAEGTTCWVPVTVDRTYGHRFMADGGGHFHQEEAIPDSPALRAVAAWLNDNPDGAIELWAHLDDLGEERETPRLLSLRDALGDALTTDGGA